MSNDQERALAEIVARQSPPPEDVATGSSPFAAGRMKTDGQSAKSKTPRRAQAIPPQQSSHHTTIAQQQLFHQQQFAPPPAQILGQSAFS